MTASELLAKAAENAAVAGRAREILPVVVREIQVVFHAPQRRRDATERLPVATVQEVHDQYRWPGELIVTLSATKTTDAP
jgi:hypothetical protein